MVAAMTLQHCQRDCDMSIQETGTYNALDEKNDITIARVFTGI